MNVHASSIRYQPLLTVSPSPPRMARILSQMTIRESQTLIRAHLLSSSAGSHLLTRSSRLVSFRCRSHRSGKPPPGSLVEIDLEADASAAGNGEVEVLGMRRLEDAIHGIMVRRSAPDWLPFIPGSSYWVPPPRRGAVRFVEMVGKLANPMTAEEALSLTSSRGWPSLAYFVEGQLPHPAEMSSKKAPTQPDDEE